MIAQRTTRRKGGRIYPYGYYRCSFAAHKGPTVCAHGTWYRQTPLEGILLERFRAATSPPLLDALTVAVTRRVEAAVRAQDARVETVKRAILRLESEAGRLVRFLRGGDSVSVREELATIESGLQGLRVELAMLQAAERPAPPTVSRARVQARVDALAGLIATNPGRARVEIRKHLEGDLELVPLPSDGPGRQVELRGRIKPNSLLTPTDQEAGSPTIGCGGWI